MTITINIPTILRSITADQKKVSSQGGSILQVIENLEREYPGIQDRLMKDGGIHQYMNIYVNDNDIRFMNDLATSVAAGDTVTILPAVAGGSGRLDARA